MSHGKQAKDLNDLFGESKAQYAIKSVDEKNFHCKPRTEYATITNVNGPLVILDEVLVIHFLDAC